MDEPNRIPLTESTQSDTTPGQSVHTDAPISPVEEPAFARGSGHLSHVSPVPAEQPERTEHSVMEGLPAAKAERVAAMRRELAELQRQLSEAQQRIATELQGRAEDAERFEALEGRLHAQELKAQQDTTRTAELDTELAGLRSQLATATALAEDLRREAAGRDAQHEERRQQHHDLTEQLELQFASLREAKASIESRDTELAATRSERDALKGELEQTRRELGTARAKVHDVANQVLRLGQDLAEGVEVARTADSSEPKPAVASPSVKRPQPPPLPRLAAQTEPEVETILELTEQPRLSSRFASALFVFGGVLLGCAVTIAIMKGSSSDSIATVGTSPTTLAAPLVTAPAPQAASGPIMPTEAIAQPPASAQTSASSPHTADTDVNAAPKDERPAGSTAPAEIPTDGVLLLPPSAAGHRVYVDGRVAEVNSSRVVVPCGTHEVRIGSSGTARTLAVQCGGETSLADETHGLER